MINNGFQQAFKNFMAEIRGGIGDIFHFQYILQAGWLGEGVVKWGGKGGGVVCVNNHESCLKDFWDAVCVLH